MLTTAYIVSLCSECRYLLANRVTHHLAQLAGACTHACLATALIGMQQFSNSTYVKLEKGLSRRKGGWLPLRHTFLLRIVEYNSVLSCLLLLPFAPVWARGPWAPSRPLLCTWYKARDTRLHVRPNNPRRAGYVRVQAKQAKQLVGFRLILC